MKTVALLDHYTKGHHLAFIKIFTKYLIKLGYHVWIFYPGHEQEIRAYVIQEREDVSMLSFHTFDLKRRKINFLGRLNYPIETLMFWWDTKVILTKVEKDFNFKFSKVFFAWLDDYLSNDLPHQAIELIFPFCWSGLYFHPNYLHEETSTVATFTSIDSVLKAKNCISVAIHDEFLVDKLHTRTGKAVVLFPEIADTANPDEDYFLKEKILSLANGRTVVGLIGLEKRKGVLYFIDLVNSADPKEFFFFLAGQPVSSGYDEVETNDLNRFLKRGKENLLFFNGYIEEGPKINAVISACDILFLVYDKFRSSSNFMTKAVYFKKLVLATNQFWIGHVTSKYNTGLSVTEGNTQQYLASILFLRTAIKKSSWDFSMYPKYMALHAEGLIEKAFQNSLGI